MHLASSRFSAQTRLLFAVLIPIVVATGCEELENKPKTPLVVRDPFYLEGNSMGTISSLAREQARVAAGYTAGNLQASFLDALDADEKGGAVFYKGVEWRTSADFGYFTEKNAPSSLMLPSRETKAFVVLNTQELSMGIFAPIGELPDPRAAEPEAVPSLDISGNTYTCVSLQDQLDGSGNRDPATPFKIMTYTASFFDATATAQNITPGEMETDRMYSYEFDTTSDPDSELVEWDQRQLLRLNLAGGSDLVAEFDADLDDEEACENFDVEDDEQRVYSLNPTEHKLYKSCVNEDGSFGGASESGDIVHFARVAYVNRKLDKTIFDGTKFPEICPDDKLVNGLFCSQPTGPVTPEVSIKAFDKGWKPRAEWHVCLRNSDEAVGNDLLSGSYWIATLQRDNGEDSLVVSEYEADGEGSGINTQILVTNDVALREERIDYNVESNGELTIYGRVGAVSPDGALFVYDNSRPAQNIISMSIGVRRP